MLNLINISKFYEGFFITKNSFFFEFLQKKNINKLLPMTTCGPKNRTMCKPKQICSPHTNRCIAQDNYDRQEKKRIKIIPEDDSGAEIPEFPQIRCGVKNNLICKPKQICNPNTKRCIDQDNYNKKYPNSQNKSPDARSHDGDNESVNSFLNDDEDDENAYQIYKKNQRAVSKLLNLIIKDNIFGDANLNVEFFTKHTREKKHQIVFDRASILLKLWKKIDNENNSQLLRMIKIIYIICNKDEVTFYDVLMIGVNLSGFGDLTELKKKTTNFILKIIAAMVLLKNKTLEEFIKTFNVNVFDKVNEELEEKFIKHVSNKKVEEPEHTDYFTEALKIITNWPIDGLDYLNGEFLLSFTRAGFDESVKFIVFVGKNKKLLEFEYSLSELIDLDLQSGLKSPYILQNIFNSMQKHSVFAFFESVYEDKEVMPDWRTLLNKLKEKNPRLRNRYLQELNKFLEIYKIEVPIVYDDSSASHIMESLEIFFSKKKNIGPILNQEVNPIPPPPLPRRRIVPIPIQL